MYNVYAVIFLSGFLLVSVIGIVLGVIAGTCLLLIAMLSIKRYMYIYRLQHTFLYCIGMIYELYFE